MTAHPEIRVVPASPGDHAQIADLYVASRADVLPALHRVRDDDQDRAWITGVVLQRGRTWVAKRGEQVVGFLALDGEDLDQLYLLPGSYRQGIGSALLAKAKEASPRRLHLYTFQVNARARAFYEAHGFRAVRFGDGSLNEEREPDVLYEWLGEA
jgi:ribosomal protein S18 acetylase RimI-like enzyme